MLALIGDAHEWHDGLRAKVSQLLPETESVIQVGDLWVWPTPEDAPRQEDGTLRVLPSAPLGSDFQWRRADRDVWFIDGNHTNFPLVRGLRVPTRVADGLTYLPRGTVRVLKGMDGWMRVGFLGGADSVLDAEWRRPGVDWWPEEERIAVEDVERLLANAAEVGGLDLLVTHSPPASVTSKMLHSSRPAHPSAVLVEEAWRALGGGVDDPPLEIVSGHMHAPWCERARRVLVLDYLEVVYR